jgi:hypothetical protein
VAGEWPEGFRLNPTAAFDDEMSRLGAAANADIVVRLVERSETVRDCATGCPEPAVRTITVSTPDKQVVASVDLCEQHGQAASNDRTNATLGIGPARHEFRDEKLRGDPEKVRQLEPVVTNKDYAWRSLSIEERAREPIGRDTLERGYGQEL